MTKDRHQRLSDLLLKVLHAPPDQRRSFLEVECGSDAQLRQDVESLLAQDDLSIKLFPDKGLTGELLAADLHDQEELSASPGASALRPGQMLSHYRLVEKIGEGGMGVVWKAADTTLPRHVAIKVLLPAFIQNEKRRRLFLNEARLASSVSDARIVQVYELGREGDVDFIVLEYVEGQPLSKLLAGGPLPPDKVVELGHQIAVSLSRAHRKKLLHRDLKPGNVLVTPDGDVKVVDFGLATLFRRDDPSPDNIGTAPSEFAQVPMETLGSHIVGTLPYMSPEQVRNEELDGRSDIFSLGTLLYEMATGKRPFLGATGDVVMQEILKARPLPPSHLVPKLPMDLGRIIVKALSLRRGDRYQNMEDLAVDLKRLGRELEAGSAPSYADLSLLAARGRQRRVAEWTLAGVVAVVLAAWAIWVFLPRANESQAARGARGAALLSLSAPIAAIASDRVAVFPFATRGSGSSGLGEGMVDMLTPLTDAAGLRSVDPYALLGLIEQQVDGSIDPLRGQAIARHFGAGLYILGSVQMAGEGLQVSASLYSSADGGKSVARATVRGTMNGVIELVDELGSELFRDHLGNQGSLSFDLASITTESPTAMMAFLKGERLLRSGEYDLAIQAYQSAVAEDPSFALSWWRMHSAANRTIKWIGLRLEAASKAMEHREHLGRRDRRLLEILFEWEEGEDGGIRIWTRGSEEAADRLRGLLTHYPETVQARYYLGKILFDIGWHKATGLDEARQMLESVLVYEPNHLLAAQSLIELCARQEQYEEAAAWTQRTLEMAPDSQYAPSLRASLVFWSDDTSEQERVIDELKNLDTWRLALAADFLEYFGKLQAAERILRLVPGRSENNRLWGHLRLAALDLAQGRWGDAQENNAASYEPFAGLALRCRFLPLGRTELEALREEAIAWEHDEGTAQGRAHVALLRVLYTGLLSARLGEPVAALQEVGKLPAIKKELDPENRLARSVAARCDRAAGLIRAELAWARGSPKDALAELDRMPSGLGIIFGDLWHDYERYMRGLLHQALGQDQEALRWYGSLGHGGPIEIGDFFLEVIYLAQKHLRMAELYEKIGQAEQAAEHYARFVELWQDCDPELRPLVDAAEASLARLRR